MMRRTAAALTALTALAALALPAASASADPNNNNSPKLRQAVTVQGIREHMVAWQAIANANNGNRLAGTSGHDASAEYVAARLRAAGYTPQFQEFTYTFNGATARRPSLPRSAVLPMRPGFSSQRPAA